MQATTTARSRETGRLAAVWSTVHAALHGFGVPVAWARGMSWRR
jgi:hypothetical protein